MTPVFLSARLRACVSGAGAAVVLACALLIGALWAAVIERVAFERAEAVEDVTVRNANLALAFEEHTLRTVKAIDLALLVIQLEYQQHGQRIDLSVLAESSAVDPGVFMALGVVDAKGRMVRTSRPFGQFDVSDREYFLHHRDHPGGELRIGKPVIGRVTGRPAIHFTRRIDSGGQFAGVAIIAVDPSYFSTIYRQLNLGRDGLIQLVGLDGVLRARRVGGGSVAGMDLRDTSLFRELARSPTGSLVTLGRFDGLPRFLSYRTVRGYPLVVGVGTSTREGLAESSVRARGYYIGASIATLVVCAFGAGLLVLWGRKRRALAAFAGSERRYRDTFDQASVGIAHAGSDGRFLRVNRKLCEMLGYAEDELLQLSWPAITHPDDAGRGQEFVARILADPSARAPEVEKRFRRKDGRWLWGGATLAVVRDACGRPEYIVTMLQDITERQQARERLEHQAHYDALTGLPNRALLEERLGLTLREAERRGAPAAVLFVDLDRFKGVNDRLGHAVGDALLREAAERLRRCVCHADTVARFGGDEFVVVLSELAHPQEAAAAALKIVEAMGPPFQVGGHELFVTASVGIATFPADGREGEALVRNADAAMFRAKQAGRNGFEFYTAATNERAMERLALDHDLRRALERGEFLLHFQPRSSLADGRITGLEALLRWQHPARGLISPAEFVPLLEESGLIVPVGDWVIGMACAQLRAWQDAGVPVVPVAVNLSARQFLHHDICPTIDRLLEQHDLDARLLEVEITESAAMLAPDRTARILARLRARRIRVAIDDFGTGYSSLGYLKHFRVDAIKLDRSFVTGLPHNPDDVAIARAVIGMARSLGLKVIAEGVETAVQRDFLAARNCDEMQGFLLARPMPAEECGLLLRSAFA